MEALRPFELSLEHSPAKFTNWRTQWDAYYSVSRLAQLPLPDQQAFLFRCLDSDLATTLRPELRPNSPMYPAPNGVQGTSVMEALDRVFLVKFPLLQRRFDWLNTRRAAGEDLGSWFAKFKQASVEAELHDVSREDLLILGIIMNVGDKVISGRILRAPDVTLEAVERIVVAAQVVGNTNVDEQPSATAAAVQPGKGKGKGRGSGGGNGGDGKGRSGGLSLIHI